MVMVFDDTGQQIPELQGRDSEVIDRILAAATGFTQFLLGEWTAAGPNCSGSVTIAEFERRCREERITELLPAPSRRKSGRKR